MGFRKAKAQQAALKMGVYGPAGSGKTLTALMVMEGLAARSGKPYAVVDTERGTDFYCQRVPERKAHPEAFEFDALYTRSLMEVLRDVKTLNPNEYAGVVVDSMTHLWEAAINAYGGRTNRAGQIPMHAWSSIKKPYKELVSWLLNTPLHVVICGRQGVDYKENDEGELAMVGYKMKAEGETAYEPHILIRMEAQKLKKSDAAPIHVGHVEKDRTGILAGKSIRWPSFDTLAAPMLHLLGEEQAQVQSAEDAAAADAEAQSEESAAKGRVSREHFDVWRAKFYLCATLDELDKVAKEKDLTAAKKLMLKDDIDRLRTEFEERRKQLS